MSVAVSSSTIVQRLWNFCNVLRDGRRLSVARQGKPPMEVGLARASRLKAVLRSMFERRSGWQSPAGMDDRS